MSTLGVNALNLADWAARVKDGKVQKIIEIMNLMNPMIDDMMFVEANGPTSHKTTIRSGLPTVAWRLLNYGVQPSKSRVIGVTDTMGMLEGFSQVDKALADLNGNTAEFRLGEDKAFLEAISQEISSTLFYGNTESDPEEFLGLAPRYDSLSSAENSENVLDGGGSASTNTSIWLVQWGENTCHGIFPKGSKAGVQHNDLGQVVLEDAQSPAGKYMGYQAHYKFDIGVSLRDWRSCVRIANVDVDLLTKDASAGADIIDLLVQALEIVPSLSMGRPVIYANKTITSFLRRQVKNTSNVNLTLDTVAGKKVLEFDGIPVHKSDALTSAEAAVT